MNNPVVQPFVPPLCVLFAIDVDISPNGKALGHLLRPAHIDPVTIPIEWRSMSMFVRQELLFSNFSTYFASFIRKLHS